MAPSPFVKRLFYDYYEKEGSKVKAPSAAEKREFGFISFDRVMVRHRAFPDENALLDFLKYFVPSDAYYSCAYYTDPQADMERKGWLGADLVFDIDADHIPTDCNKVHDDWVCGSCGFAGKGVAPEKCPDCGKEKFETRTWPCDVCLNSAKNETVKLLDMLKADLGFSGKEIHVYFSGHRGYHVHLESESVHTLDTAARKEIVDYCSGLGLELPLLGIDEKSWGVTRSPEGLRMRDSGWRERVAMGLQKFITKAEEKDFVQAGLQRAIADKIVKNKEHILKSLLVTGTSSAVKGVGFETWKKLIEQVVRLESAKIDTVVTTDTHRLIRLVGSLHSKTGFMKVEFPSSAIVDFDPFTEGVAFHEGTAKTFVSDAPEFRVRDEWFGPFKNIEVDLPTAVAVLLVCKGRAKVLE